MSWLTVNEKNKDEKEVKEEKSSQGSESMLDTLVNAVMSLMMIKVLERVMYGQAEVHTSTGTVSVELPPDLYEYINEILDKVSDLEEKLGKILQYTVETTVYKIVGLPFDNVDILISVCESIITIQKSVNADIVMTENINISVESS